jgi:hypothetical protein
VGESLGARDGKGPALVPFKRPQAARKTNWIRHDHGHMPTLIGAALLGHLNIQTTRGYVAVFDEHFDKRKVDLGIPILPRAADQQEKSK